VVFARAARPDGSEHFAARIAQPLDTNMFVDCTGFP
jgi:hypothetical protein